MMPTLTISCAQLTKLLQYLPADEGYLRIQFIASCFSRIVDLENMHLIVYELLTADERNEVLLAVNHGGDLTAA